MAIKESLIAESKKIEFWNFLTTEKHQPRPKGITVHRLAMLKTAILGADELWLEIIGSSGAANLSAAEFYGANETAALQSRAGFWSAVRKLIGGNETKGIGRTHKPARPAKDQPTKSSSRIVRRKRS